jgi:hypothetical protein
LEEGIISTRAQLTQQFQASILRCFTNIYVYTTVDKLYLATTNYLLVTLIISSNKYKTNRNVSAVDCQCTDQFLLLAELCLP